jgi:hypothetical protein
MAEIMDNFKGLPMSELIGAPLTAACDAQKRLARAQYEFIKDIAFEDDKGTKARIIEFNLQRPVETPDGVKKVDTHVEAPFLGLVPIPSLLVEDVNIEFQMEVSATETSKDKTDTELSVNTTASFGFFSRVKVEVQGKVTSSRENTRQTNQAAKYQVRVVARQQQPTEGLSRLMDVMAQCVAPLPPQSPQT